MFCIKYWILFIALLFVECIYAQKDFTTYFQPKVSLNYKVLNNYGHNFSIAQRNYIYRKKNTQWNTKQFDLAHYSRLKLQTNQSIALGIQYRFRKNFEPNKENELRIIEQYNFTQKPNAIRLGHRIRAEQRITQFTTIHRFRYRFAVDFPLKGEKIDVGEPYIILSTESLGSFGKDMLPEFDHRLSGNIGWLLKQRTKLQISLAYRWENYGQQTEPSFFFKTNLILNL